MGFLYCNLGIPMCTW